MRQRGHDVRVAVSGKLLEARVHAGSEGFNRKLILPFHGIARG